MTWFQRTSSLAVCITLLQAIAAAAAQVDVNGIQVGTDSEAALFRTYPNAVCVFTAHPPVDKNCMVRTTYVGAPALVMYLVLHDKVIGAMITVKQTDFDRVVAGLTQKYSTPTLLRRGVAPADVVPHWSVGGASILAFRHNREKPDSDSMIVFETDASRQFMAQRSRGGSAGAVPIAAQAVDEFADNLLPQVERARSAVLNDFTRSTYETEMIVNVAVMESGKLLSKRDQLPQLKDKLRTLEGKVGSLREFPHWELHGLLGAVATLEGNAEDRVYHAAFQRALLKALERTGDGKTPATAFQVIGVREEYVWLNSQADRLKPKSRIAKEIEGKAFDVWTVATSGGEEEVYFDITSIRETVSRGAGVRR